MEPVPIHRHLDLAHASELAKAHEHFPDRGLKPGIGIEVDPAFPVPDEASRHKQAQLAALGLALGCIGHSSTHLAELERDETALHSKQ